jgi:hypothetical protein
MPMDILPILSSEVQAIMEGMIMKVPQIKLFLNDEKFVNGGITNQNPVLIVKLSDSSGINTTGTGHWA